MPVFIGQINYITHFILGSTIFGDTDLPYSCTLLFKPFDGMFIEQKK